MAVTSVMKDLERATLVVVAEYPAATSRVWQLWADPRLLERWWGPPTHPATVTYHDLTADGTVRYFMTGPEGERYHGGWSVVRVDEPSVLEFEDYFANDDGTENREMPRSTTIVNIEDAGPTTRMTIETRYPSADALAAVLEMGMEEGMRQALGQIDEILTGSAV